MRWRKGLSLFFIMLVTALFVSVIETDVAKASGTKVTIDYYGKSSIMDPAMAPGTQFTVNVTVDYVELLWAYQFELGKAIFGQSYPEHRGWNASILRLLSVANGPFLGSNGGTVVFFLGTIDNTWGTLSLTCGGLDPNRRWPTGGGTFATLTFEVVGVGYSPIHFGGDTALLNKTGGYELGPDWRPLRGTLNPSFIVDGSFDNRASVNVSPSLVRGVPVGENFTINIEALNITNLHSWVFSLRWNATILNVTDVGEGDFLKSAGTTDFDAGEINTTRGEISDVSAHLTESVEVSGSGTLANLTFTVLDMGTCRLTLYNVTLRDSAGQKLSYGTSDGAFDNLKVHNIEVTSVTPYPTSVEEGSGESISIDVVVANTGSYNETGIDVSVSCDQILVGKEMNVSLGTVENKTRTLTFTWNTTGVPRGRYTVTANASFVAEEADTKDNIRTAEATILAHDVAIVRAWTPVTFVFSGRNVTITVDVANKGTEAEDFNVTAYYDSTEICRVGITDLGYKESRTLKLVWTTTGVPIGNYTITVRASVVEGEEEGDRGDNVYVKPGKIAVIPWQQEALSTEFMALIAAPFVAVGAIVVYYIRRRRSPAET